MSSRDLHFRNTIEPTIAGLVAKRFDVPVMLVNRTSRFREDLKADSLDKLDFTLSVEEQFGVVIFDGEMDNIGCVGELVDLVRDKMTENST